MLPTVVSRQRQNTEKSSHGLKCFLNHKSEKNPQTNHNKLGQNNTLGSWIIHVVLLAVFLIQCAQLCSAGLAQLDSVLGAHILLGLKEWWQRESWGHRLIQAPTLWREPGKMGNFWHLALSDETLPPPMIQVV